MANLTPAEYINIQFPNRGFELISAVRVDSPTSKWKPTVQRVVVLIKVAKKEAMTATLWTNEFESDGTTLKKQDTGYYFDLEDGVTYDKSKSEMETLVSDKQEQLKILNRRISEIKGGVYGPGGWVITQDPWDPNVVPKSLAPDEPVKTTVTEKPIVQANTSGTSGTSGTSIQTEPQIYGEFTFNVEDAFLFKGNQEFDLLEILYKGLTKEEVEVIEEEEIDEEYEETDYAGDELYDVQFKALEEFTIAAFKEDPELEALSNSESDTASTSTSAKATVGDSSDFWALVAICACEDSDDQGRADVAQSIYNRVASKLFGGKTIKRVVTASWQFEPAFDKGHRSRTHATWNAISDKDTAIAAIKYAKNYNTTQATNALKSSFDAIYDSKRQKEAKDYIGQRTDFLGAGLGKSWYKGTGKWSSGKSSSTPIRRSAGSPNNIFGNVCGGGSYAYGKKNIIADVPTELLNKFKF